MSDWKEISEEAKKEVLDKVKVCIKESKPIKEKKGQVQHLIKCLE